MGSSGRRRSLLLASPARRLLAAATTSAGRRDHLAGVGRTRGRASAIRAAARRSARSPGSSSRPATGLAERRSTGAAGSTSSSAAGVGLPTGRLGRARPVAGGRRLAGRRRPAPGGRAGRARTRRPTFDDPRDDPVDARLARATLGGRGLGRGLRGGWSAGPPASAGRRSATGSARDGRDAGRRVRGDRRRRRPRPGAGLAEFLAGPRRGRGSPSPPPARRHGRGRRPTACSPTSSARRLVDAHDELATAEAAPGALRPSGRGRGVRWASAPRGRRPRSRSSWREPDGEPLLETLAEQIAPDPEARAWLAAELVAAEAAGRRRLARRAGRRGRRPARPRAAVPGLAPGRVDGLGPPALPAGRPGGGGLRRRHDPGRRSKTWSSDTTRSPSSTGPRWRSAPAS